MDRPPTSNGWTLKPLLPDSIARGGPGSVVAALLYLGSMTVMAADSQLLPAEQAFRYSARALNDHTLEARFAIADGYYLYRDKLKFAVSPDSAVLGSADLPAGKVKTDEFFGKVETYRGTVVVTLPLSGAAAGHTVVLAADSQGCADVGVCYPPSRQKLSLALPVPGAGPGAMVDAIPPKKTWFK
jgi:thioredoxin:protein disulfide reductase